MDYSFITLLLLAVEGLQHLAVVFRCGELGDAQGLKGAGLQHDGHALGHQIQVPNEWPHVLVTTTINLLGNS